MAEKILTAFTHGGTVKTAFMTTLIDWLETDRAQRNLRHDPAIMAAAGDYQDSRNLIPQAFLESKAERLLIIDSDIIFTPYDVYRLYDALDPVERPIISGLAYTYLAAAPYPMPEWFDQMDDGRFSTVKSIDAGGLQQISAFGFSIQMYHRSALEKMREAYKGDPWPWFGRDIVDMPELGRIRLGDDISFGRRCGLLGIPIYGLGSVQVGHIKTRVENAQTYFVSNEFLGGQIRAGMNPPGMIIHNQESANGGQR